jgi:hypothetical protein
MYKQHPSKNKPTAKGVITYRAIEKPFIGEIFGEVSTGLEAGHIRVVLHTPFFWQVSQEAQRLSLTR